MLNRLLLSSLQQEKAHQPQAMIEDIFENPATYNGWIYPLRYLLALRYLKQKQKVLSWFKSKNIYPVLNDQFHNALALQLSGQTLDNSLSQSQNITIVELSKASAPVFSFGFKSTLVYSVLLVGLIFGLVSLNSWHQQQRIHNALANHLPYFSDLLHRKLMLKHNSNEEVLRNIDTTIEKEQKKILADLPEEDGIRELMRKQLEKLKDSSSNSSDIMLGFKDINTLFDTKELPFYLSPKSYSMLCSSLIDAPVEQMMMIKKMEELMSSSTNNTPERCRTTMMTAYKVGSRNALFYKAESDNKTDVSNEKERETELPLFSVKRIDKVPAVDSALGLTFKDHGIGSIILTDKITKFAQESVLPALTFQGRNYIIPYWMQGYYEVEEAITKGYQKDLDAIYTNKAERRKVKALVKKLIKNKSRMKNAKLKQSLEQTGASNTDNIFGNGFDAISVLLNKDSSDKEATQRRTHEIKPKDLALLKKLEGALIPSIEYHEAYHQIDKKNWTPPFWLTNTFEGKLSGNQIDHALEELGAYLSQLSNTKQGHNIWLSKLLIFSLNPMTKGQSEYYASSLILKTMESVYLRKPVKFHYIATVEEKVLIYKTLAKMNKQQIQLISKIAYKILFQREVPQLYQ